MLRVCLLVLSLSMSAAALAKDEAPAGAPALAAANNAFAWDLYEAVRGGDDNLFFSPYSVTTALAMARAGARGETAVAMDRVLHLAGVDPSEGFRALVRSLEPPTVRDGVGRDARMVRAYALDVANALWGQQGYPFEPAFTKLLADAYGAPLERVDFTDTAGARRPINAWVEQRTRGKIRDIVPPGMPPPDTRLALANAIYFKANWAKTFSKYGTKEGEFTGPGGKIIRAPFMHLVHSYPHADLGAAWALEMPYKGRTTSMVVLLPKKKDGLADLEQALATLRPTDWSERLAKRRVDLKFPRFEFTRALDLTGTLARMGMGVAFDAAQADFSGMTKTEKLFIGAVLHKAFVAVDEEGTEAAAATVLVARGASFPREEPVPFHADHPFVFLIRHVPTNTILFLGRVTDPTKS